MTTEIIGRSFEGRELMMAKICRGGCGNKPAMYIQGGIHVSIVIAIQMSCTLLMVMYWMYMTGSRVDVTGCGDLHHKRID